MTASGKAEIKFSKCPLDMCRLTTLPRVHLECLILAAFTGFQIKFKPFDAKGMAGSVA